MNNFVDDETFSDDDSFIESVISFFENNCYEEKGNNKRNIVDEMLFADEEVKEKKIKINDDIAQNDIIEYSYFSKQLVEDISSVLKNEPKEFSEQLVKDISSVLENEPNEDLDSNYNKLIYRGQNYYVKKRNFEFPICVMNDNLVQVGIISEDNINNIKMI